MNWLLRRVLTLWLVLAVTFAAVLLIVRLNRTPDALQALSFDLCDGEPCFRGIKLGSDWTDVRSVFPEAQDDKDTLMVLRNDGAFISLFSDNGRVFAIEAVYPLGGIHPAGVGEIISRYGWPCRLVMLDYNGLYPTMRLIYPKLQVRIETLIGGQSNPTEYRQQVNPPIMGLYITTDDSYGTCSSPTSTGTGPWRGFTSAEIYISRNRRDFAIPQP
jgi:hypothetical protein